MRSPECSVLSGGRSWTEERHAEVRLRARGPLGALFSLEVAAGLKEDRQRRGLGQYIPWELCSHQRSKLFVKNVRSNIQQMNKNKRKHFFRVIKTFLLLFLPQRMKGNQYIYQQFCLNHQPLASSGLNRPNFSTLRSLVVQETLETKRKYMSRKNSPTKGNHPK